MRTRFHISLAVAAAVAVALAVFPSFAAAAAPPGTAVSASAAQVAGFLFVAGDVGRLSQVPSGTESLVLERVLQQLYTANPGLDPAQAVSDIHSLQQALSSGPQALSAGTLTVMAGNQRILAILRVLTDSNPPADVAHAVAQVTDQALNEASQSARAFGQAFDPSADSRSTIAYISFLPARVLTDTVALAASNQRFGQARDMLWQQASHASVFDDTHTLLSENPALQNDAVKGFVAMLAPDGTLTTTVGQLESMVKDGITQIGGQNCTLASGATGASPSDCSSGALHDAQVVAQACPNGAATTDPGCTSARARAQADGGNEIAAITAQQAATTAEADALGQADTALQQAEAAEAQAAAQIADDENQYLEYQAVGSLEKGGFDVATLVVNLSVSEIDPAYVASSLFSVIGDLIGFSTGGPDPQTIVLEGIQNISQQLSDFETYTQTAFKALDTGLANISSQIALDAHQLSVQLTQIQGQVTQLQSNLTKLQGSVDHLESEVQSLFAQGARNDLGTLVNQYLGYRQANGVPLPQTQFAQAAGALYQDATSTALTQTVLNPPANFDALNASGLVSAIDPFSLDSNINFFNLFGAQVTDSPSDVTWPGALTTTCAANSDPAHGLCIPDPDFWATSARAFSQLLSENPQYVTPTRLTQLDAIVQEGRVIANALHQLSVNDAGADTNGTGNRTLDAAINYYGYWGGNRIPYNRASVPELGQALHNEEQHYLDNTPVPGLGGLTYGAIHLYDGPSQTPDLKTLLTTDMFKKVPLCQSEVNDGATGMINPHDFVLPRLTADETSFLPAEVLNGARLGAGQISACWTAKYTGSRDSSGGQATMTLQFTYASAAGTELVAFIQWSGFLSTCGITNFENSETDAINAARACPDSVENDFGNSTVKDVFDAHPADAVSGVNAKLAELQAGYYKDILSGGGSTLTSGTSIDTDVEAAARRLAGANAILNGYISLGLPQSLASDDNLRSLVSGANADAFARTSPSLNPWGVAYASDVPAQLVNFYKAALTAKPSLDPADEAADLVFLRSLALQQAIRPHIVPSAGTASTKSIRLAAGITAQPSDATFAETNPFIGPTLDRVDETRAALADTLANGATLYTSVAGAGAGTVSDGSALSCSGTCSHNYTPGTSVTLTATPAAGSRFAGWSGACTGTGTCTVLLDYDQNVTAGFAPGPAPGAPTTSTTPTTTTPPASGHTHATGVRCTLKPNGNTVLLAKRHGRNHRHDPKPGTLTLTVRCDQAAAVRLTGRLTTLTGRARSHGKRRGQTTLLGPVRASVRAGAARSLTITIPTGALKALARHQRESVTFSLSATNANGASTATATVRTLAGIR